MFDKINRYKVSVLVETIPQHLRKKFLMKSSRY